MDKPEPTPQDTALEWFVRLRDSALSAEERTAFETWRRADPAHAEAYREAEALWAALDQLEEMPAPTASASADIPAPARLRRSAAPRRRLWQMAQAAVVAAVVVAAGYAFTTPLPLSSLMADYRTAVGERASYQLADGSRIELDAASALSVSFAADRRHATLHGGEAFFQVSRDPARPFVVQTGVGRIEVLGTAFAVRTVGDSVDVVVTESRVAVSHANGGRAELRAGQSIRLGPDGMGAVGSADIGQALAWRDGKLVFRNAPLAEVVGVLQRHRPGRIDLMDAGLADLRLTGSFSADAGEKALESIEAAFPVRLVRLTDYLVLIFPQPRDGS